jgi:hypothetical protein
MPTAFGEACPARRPAPDASSGDAASEQRVTHGRADSLREGGSLLAFVTDPNGYRIETIEQG